MLDRTTFKFEGNQLTFAKDVNDERVDTDVNHAVEAAPLDGLLDESWTEALFYGRGNSAM